MTDDSPSITEARAVLLAVMQARIRQEEQALWAAVWRDFHRIGEDVARAMAPLVALLQTYAAQLAPYLPRDETENARRRRLWAARRQRRMQRQA